MTAYLIIVTAICFLFILAAGVPLVRGDYDDKPRYVIVLIIITIMAELLAGWGSYMLLYGGLT